MIVIMIWVFMGTIALWFITQLITLTILGFKYGFINEKPEFSLKKTQPRTDLQNPDATDLSKLGLSEKELAKVALSKWFSMNWIGQAHNDEATPETIKTVKEMVEWCKEHIPGHFALPGEYAISGNRAYVPFYFDDREAAALFKTKWL